MRKTIFAENEHYHLCSRGLDREQLFKDDRDYIRFLFLMLYYQSPLKLNNTSYYVSCYLKKERFCLNELKLKELAKRRQLEVVSFALMPNHFHILIKNIEEHAASAYMQRVLMAYGKYYNEKYKRVGHVFDGPYKCTHIENNKQLLHVSCYIHKNPIDIKDYSFNYESYPYSSYQDYIGNNRWDELLKPNIVLSQFKSPSNYKDFVSTNPTKEEDLMLDL